MKTSTGKLNAGLKSFGKFSLRSTRLESPVLESCEYDSVGNERLILNSEGWDRWNWKGYDCHYISAGEDNSGSLVILVHGFGAHSYHWRYTIPYLARRGFRVFALCMLGYGWSPKASEPYSIEFWGSQVIDFAKDVAGASEKDKAIIAGNSIGALAALYAASSAQEICSGLCLVNAAGKFEPEATAEPAAGSAAQMNSESLSNPDSKHEILRRVQEIPSRLTALAVFLFTKLRVRQILQQVYTRDVDNDLVRSIEMAATGPGVLEAYYQITLAGGRSRARPRDLLERFGGPVMLLWGEKDPWMTPSKADTILAVRPDAVYRPVDAGHCPHDDAPAEANAALAEWALGLMRK